MNLYVYNSLSMPPAGFQDKKACRINIKLFQIQVLHIWKLNYKLDSWLWLYYKIKLTLSYLE